MKCLTVLLGAQVGSIWSESNTQRVFQLLLNYTVHPKPKVSVKHSSEYCLQLAVTVSI